ncbi:ephrin-A4 isoform X1 [Apus apus]|uniref:ephrin-A4 isoform X1 n=1 Tax=Apus apus TaxID=8895 RepID=UPI0021F8F3BF|nr:ephrin-A4 isoform X1 [Apus apus]
MRPAPLLGLLLWAPLLWAPPPVHGYRHGVHWNGSNPRFLRDDYTIKVAINDYLDIYCPHYEGAVPTGRAETFTLFMVDQEGYRSCRETPGAFKRWECNRPRAPFGPVRFSEKIQRFTPFSLGFEFQPGETYYYISVPTPESAGRCLKLRVSVCCRGTSESCQEAAASQKSGATPPLPGHTSGGGGVIGLHWGLGGTPCPPGEPVTDTVDVCFSTRAGDGGSQLAAPWAWGSRGCSSRPGHHSSTAAPCPVPGACAPHSALDLTLSAARGGGMGSAAPCPLPHSSSTTIPSDGAAVGHNLPAGLPQS